MHRQGETKADVLIIAPHADLDVGEFTWNGTFTDLGDFPYKQDGAYYIDLYFKDAAHAIGIAGAIEKTISFFDPNAGDYEVSGVLFGKFMAAYKTSIEKEFGEVRRITINNVRLQK
jgi:hypothetical protein